MSQVSNLIYEGPPGTGKTLRAKQRAVEVIDGYAPDAPEEVSRRFRELVEQERIFAPTLHPSYSYADWVEGYRPVATETMDLHWNIEPGVLLRAVSACWSPLPGYASHFVVGQTITSSTGSAYDVVQVDTGRVILRRHDARKNLRSDRAEVYFDDVKRCEDRGVEPRELSYSGADEANRAARAQVAERLGWSTTQLTNSGALRAVYEHILTCRTEGSATTRPVVLMIDEINRADPGRLWGEALTLLEPNRRQGQPEEQPVILQFSGRTLTLPAELHIIGTMNSADRSIAQFDVAYRRRFDFIFISPESSLLEVYGDVDLPALLERLNTYMRRHLGRDRQVGHAELMAHKLEARRVEHGWADDADGRLRAVAYTLRTFLLPLLRDQLVNDLVRVRAALGPFGGVVEEVDDDLAIEEETWLDDNQAYLDDGGSWWDPTSSAWDGDRVRKALVDAPLKV